MVWTDNSSASSYNRSKGAVIFQRVGSHGTGKLHLAVQSNTNTSSATVADAKVTIEAGGEVWYPERSSNGSFTQYAGTINPMGNGNRYLHVKFNIRQDTIFHILWDGHDYNNAKAASGHFAGYHYSTSGIIQQYMSSDTAIAIYMRSDSMSLDVNSAAGYVCICIDTYNTNTTNRWGAYQFRCGMDTIVTNYAVKILAHSWQSTNSNPF